MHAKDWLICVKTWSVRTSSHLLSERQFNGPCANLPLSCIAAKVGHPPENRGSAPHDMSANMMQPRAAALCKAACRGVAVFGVQRRRHDHMLEQRRPAVALSRAIQP